MNRYIIFILAIISYLSSESYQWSKHKIVHPNKMIKIDGKEYYGGDLQFLQDLIYNSEDGDIITQLKKVIHQDTCQHKEKNLIYLNQF